MLRHWLAAGAVALTVGTTTGTAQAAGTTQPGEQVGLAYGPLPEGVYAINTFSWGEADARGAPGVGVNIPLLAWATPYKIFGAQIIPLIAVPSVFVSTVGPGAQDQSYFYNPLISTIFAFDLGNKISAGWLIGAYVPFGDRGSLCNGNAGFGAPSTANPTGANLGCTPILPQLASTTIRNTFGLSYTGDGWNLTGALTYNFMTDDAARFGGRVGQAIGPVGNADGLYIDITATKSFDLFNEGKPKFEIGMVAFGYTDLPVNYRNPAYANFVRSGAPYARAGQFAVGGLVGYDFGPFKAQAWVTREVAQRAGPQAEETRGWFRLIAPLYTAPAAAPVAEAPPMVSKY